MIEPRTRHLDNRPNGLGLLAQTAMMPSDQNGIKSILDLKWGYQEQYGALTVDLIAFCLIASSPYSSFGKRR